MRVSRLDADKWRKLVQCTLGACACAAPVYLLALLAQRRCAARPQQQYLALLDRRLFGDADRVASYDFVSASQCTPIESQWLDFFCRVKRQ